MEKNFLVRPLVNCIPAWIRFAQCLRRYYDSREVFPHLVNAGKYSTTFFVVIFGTLKGYYKGKNCIQGVQKPKLSSQTETVKLAFKSNINLQINMHKKMLSDGATPSCRFIQKNILKNCPKIRT